MEEWKNPNFYKAMKNAINGIKYALKNERNTKIQVCLGIIAIILGFLLKVSLIEWVIIVTTIAIVIATEFINTAIERTVDLIVSDYNEKAKIIKDISAGAVLIICIASSIIGTIIFLPKIINYIR